MRARDAKSQLAATAPAREGAGDPFSEVADGGTVPRVTELVGQAQEAARGMVEAEDALRLVREHFERTDDPEARGELTAEALDHVERQLRLLPRQPAPGPEIPTGPDPPAPDPKPPRPAPNPSPIPPDPNPPSI
jgi:hypothetical protein